jgi:hypothetical protein
MAPLAQLMIARTAGKHFIRVVGYVAVPVLPGWLSAQLSRALPRQRPGSVERTRQRVGARFGGQLNDKPVCSTVCKV